jgi:pyruvate formate lyase activating enzyme
MSESKGLIFNIQRFSLHDGPGIRTTIFLKGCPLKCRWCHNPEGINIHPEILYKSFSCIRCESCIKSCPQSAILLKDGYIKIDRRECDLCGICTDSCSSNSLEICGRNRSVMDVFNEVIVDSEFYETSKGGITLSGGEPLVQYEFTKALITKFKENQLHVCLDTSGFVERNKFRKVLEMIDMLLFDVKTLNDIRHKQLTGVSNQLILRNLEESLNYNLDIIIRTPVVIGYNFINLDQELYDHIKFLLEMGFVNFELIPYHRFGEQKYQMLGRKYDIKVII